jgi:cephalosporin hydroxylase
MFDRIKFEKDKRENVIKQRQDQSLNKLAVSFIEKSDQYNYAYQWTWLGLPIIQMPEDIIITQEIIWDKKPDVIIETGIAWGGSIVMYASILELIGKGNVIAVDKVLPQSNVDAIMQYPFSKRINLFEGSSTDPQVYEEIKKLIKPTDKVMVLLDSNHTHEHVFEELKVWSSLVTPGQYLVVSDTIIEDIPPQAHRVRSWGPGNNPKTALREFLKQTNRFNPDNYYNNKALATFTCEGYLECI